MKKCVSKICFKNLKTAENTYFGEFGKVLWILIPEKAWLDHKQVKRNIYVLYIFRIQFFAVPIEVIKPNTLVTTEIIQ